MRRGRFTALDMYFVICDIVVINVGIGFNVLVFIDDVAAVVFVVFKCWDGGRLINMEVMNLLYHC